MEDCINCNFKEFCNRVATYEINDIYEAINNECSNIYRAKVNPKMKEQYQDDLLILLKLFMGLPLPENLRHNYIEDSIRLLFKLRNHLVSLTNLSETIKKIRKKNSDVLFDLITIVVSKEEIANNDLSQIKIVLDQLLDKRKIRSLRNTVNISFHGYNDISMELFHIPKFRNFIYELDKYFPYWFYYLNKNTEALRVITFSLCGVISAKPGLVKINQDHFAEFLEYHFHSVNVLMEHYDLGEEINELISNEIIEYYQLIN